MKTTTIKKAFSSLAIVSALAMAPAVFAADASTTANTSVRINSDGIVHIVGAEVTSVSGSIINAITRFKNNLITSWAFTTNASTTVTTGNGVTASTTNPLANIAIGDRLDITGALSALGTTIGVNATKVKDMTSFALARGKTGTVQSVSTSTGTFVIKSDDKLITIQTNASTTFAITGTTTPLTLGSLVLNSKVKVVGVANSDGTIITATTVLMKVNMDKKNDDNEGENDNKNKNKENNGESHGLKNGWKNKEDRTNSGKHEGFLKTNIGLELGEKND